MFVVQSAGFLAGDIRSGDIAEFVNDFFDLLIQPYGFFYDRMVLII